MDNGKCYVEKCEEGGDETPRAVGKSGLEF